MTIRFRDGKSTFLDFRERASRRHQRPCISTRMASRWRAPAWTATLARRRARFSRRLRAARGHGTLTRQELMEPAIRFAKDGFVLEQAAAPLKPEPHGWRRPGRGRHLPETGRQALRHWRSSHADRSRGVALHHFREWAGCVLQKGRLPTPSSRRVATRAAFWPRRISKICGSRARCDLQLSRLRDHVLAAAEFGGVIMRNSQRAGILSAFLFGLRLGRDRPRDGRGDAPCLCRQEFGAWRSASSTTRSQNCWIRPMPGDPRRSIRFGPVYRGSDAEGLWRAPDDALFHHRQ